MFWRGTATVAGNQPRPPRMAFWRWTGHAIRDVIVSVDRKRRGTERSRQRAAAALRQETVRRQFRHARPRQIRRIQDEPELSGVGEVGSRRVRGRARRISASPTLTEAGGYVQLRPSGRTPLVAMVQAADFRERDHRALSRHLHASRNGRVFLNGRVRSRPLITERGKSWETVRSKTSIPSLHSSP